MDFLAVAVLFGLMVVGMSLEPVNPVELDIEVPEITEDFFDEIIQYLPCSDGMCEYLVTPQAEVVKQTPAPSYNEFCQDISHGLHDIDDKYPKLKDLKSKLYTYFFSSMAEYERNPEKRKNIAVQVLSELIKLFQMLKKRIQDCPVKHVPKVTVPLPEEIVPEEIIAEEVDYPRFVGSVRGIPGVHYPNYTEVPITSFTCSDKKYIPGFYADLETGCQVFHVCYNHRRESFLCPIGTLFNQPILACDYWYSSNCSLSPHYYDVNEEKDQVHLPEGEEDHIEELITTIIEQEKPAISHIAVKSKDSLKIEAELDQIFKFLPVKAKVVEFPEKPIPKPLPMLEPKFIKAAVAIPVIKVAAKAVPIVKAKIVDSVTTKVEGAIKTKVASKIVPVIKVKAAGVAKAKLAAAAAAAAPVVKAKVLTAAVPVVKTKIAATAAAAAPIVKAKVLTAAVPVVKTKIAAATAAAAAPVVKAKVLTAAVPVVKTKIAAAAATPFVKSKVLSAAAGPLLKAKATAKVLPVVKTAAAFDAKILASAKAKKVAMISPLTKKALALGYMKLLKAKKLALMG